MRVLAIGAHPDDIELACSGTLDKCVKRGDTIIVCHASLPTSALQVTEQLPTAENGASAILKQETSRLSTSRKRS